MINIDSKHLKAISLRTQSMISWTTEKLETEETNKTKITEQKRQNV